MYFVFAKEVTIKIIADCKVTVLYKFHFLIIEIQIVLLKLLSNLVTIAKNQRIWKFGTYVDHHSVNFVYYIH